MQSFFAHILFVFWTTMRKAAVPRPEIQVLKRLREAREKLGLSQYEFAAEMGISRAQVANYDYLRAPLPLALGLRICHHFVLGERWLATGKGPFRQLLDLSTLPSKFLSNADDPLINSSRLTFAAGYKRHYSDYADKASLEMERSGQLFRVNMGALMDLDRSFVRNYLHALIEQWMSKIDEEAKLELLCSYLSKEGTAYVSKLSKLKVEYDWDETKRYFVDPAGKREEIEPFKNERDKYLEEGMDDVVKVLRANPGVTAATLSEDLLKKETETHAQLAKYAIEHIDELRKVFANDPQALKNFETLIEQHKGIRRTRPEETILTSMSPDTEWDLAHVGIALEIKKDLAELVGSNIKKIRKLLPKKSEELAQLESFLKTVKADKSGASLEGFSAVQAAKVVHILRALHMMEEKVPNPAQYDGPYPEAAKKQPNWN
jgi:transcriptional regulator with XRE-family HTH domain